MDEPVAVPDVEKPDPIVVEEPAEEVEERLQLGVQATRERLEQVLRRVVQWQEKGFKKLPASTVIDDFNFLLMVVKVLSAALEETRQRAAEERNPGPRQGELVDVGGNVIRNGELKTQLVKLT